MAAPNTALAFKGHFSLRKRTWTSILIALSVLAALLLAVYLRKKAPPEAARLLPEADAIVYFNLRPLRTLTHFEPYPVEHDAAYQAFTQATGIQFERDLEEAAFAIHRMPDPTGPNGAVAYSEVFVGRFDGVRLAHWLAAQSADTERYADHDIYRIPHEGRTVRVTLLGYDMVAVSNTPTPEQVHSIIDRYHSAALPFSGPTLLAQHYSDVPLLAQAWGIGKIGLPFGRGHDLRFLGVPLPLPADTTFIASVRYLGSLRLRVEEIAPTEGAAQAFAQVANLTIQLLRSGLTSDTSQDPALANWQKFLNSATVQQKGDRAILQAVLPVGLLEDLLSAGKDAATPPADANSQNKP
jgi:hypothetical protein